MLPETHPPTAQPPRLLDQFRDAARARGIPPWLPMSSPPGLGASSCFRKKCNPPLSVCHTSPQTQRPRIQQHDTTHLVTPLSSGGKSFRSD
jgi:hypothetical protein